jgi:hypothetical protein
MKLDIEKLNIIKLTDNISSIKHDNNILKFWTPKILMPFGILNEYNKQVIKLELEDNNKDNLNKEHLHLRKVILHIENLIKEKINANDQEFKSIIIKRPNKSDFIDIRIKTNKNTIITEVEYEDKDNNYLRTIYDIPKQSYVKIQIEINGLWDYRTDKKESNKTGLIVYVTKIIVLK